MRALIQRVEQAEVRLPGEESRTIGRGLLIYLGVGRNDTPEDARRLAEKTANLRIFSNPKGKFDRSVLEERGEILVISQFTLYADPRGGRRPDFTSAAPPREAKALYERFAERLSQAGLAVKTGEFGARMSISSVNDGPVTIWLDTELL